MIFLKEDIIVRAFVLLNTGLKPETTESWELPLLQLIDSR